MTRLYARALSGQRIREATPGGHWKIMTILGAMSLRGMIATIRSNFPALTVSAIVCAGPGPVTAACAHKPLRRKASPTFWT